MLFASVCIGSCSLATYTSHLNPHKSLLRPYITLYNELGFCGEELLALRPTPELEGYPL
jgi:hypothetical protein